MVHGLIGAGLSLLGGLAGGRRAYKGLRQAQGLAQFRPFNISSLLGDVNFKGQNVNIGTGSFLTEILKNINARRGEAQNIGAGFLSQLRQFDPFQAAQTQFNTLEKILQPERDAARQQLQNKLLSQGRLGSISTNIKGDITGGGAADQLALEQAIERERQRNLINQFGLAQQTQQNLFNIGSGLFGLAGQQDLLGIRTGLASLEPLRLSALLSSTQAEAGANAGRFAAERGKRSGDLISGFLSGLGNFIGGL